MDYDELHYEFYSLGDSLDTSITAEDVIFALEALIKRLEEEGLG